MNRPSVSLTLSRCLILASAAAILTPVAASAQTEPKRVSLTFRGPTTTIQSSHNLSPGHYTGGGGIIMIDGGKDRRCSFDISASVVENAKLHVREGSELTMRGTLLRNCQIYVEPKAAVSITNTGLQNCEFNGFADTRRGFPSVKITNSVIADSAVLKAINWLGLDMQDSMVLNQRSGTSGFMATEVMGNTFSDLARSPRIRYTSFSKCELHPNLFFASSHCTFTGCSLINATSAPTPSQEGSVPIVLPLRWMSGNPATPPTVGRGVVLESVSNPFPGGCSLEHEWDGATLTVASIIPNGDPSTLASALPTAVLASGGSSASSSSMASASSTAASLLNVKLPQTAVNGLLVMPLPSGKEAGQVTKMTLTALPGASYVRFAQPVGTDMETSLREVQKFMRLRHKELPASLDFEISFEEKYSGKDGPSAAVACALLMESSLTGKTWDPAFAVTGDMNSDGSVQPIGGVAAKIRGATNGSCQVIGIPVKNEVSAADILVRDGPAPLINITVFTISNFEEALALAAADRTGPLLEAMTEMSVITNVLKRDPRAAPAILKTSQAVTRLQSVLTKAPNCISAKYLLMYAQGVAPRRLSLIGSIDAADTDAQALSEAINRDVATTTNNLGQDELGGNLNRLRNLRPMLDQRVWPYVDGLVDFGEAVRNILINPPRTAGRASEMSGAIRSAASRAVTAKQKLLSDPIVREEIGL